jgi:hypothetical protein
VPSPASPQALTLFPSTTGSLFSRRLAAFRNKQAADAGHQHATNLWMTPELLFCALASRDRKVSITELHPLVSGDQ